MGRKIENSTRFVLRNLLTGGKKASQFIINTGKSVAIGAKEAVNDVEPYDFYTAPKPQATRKPKK